MIPLSATSRPPSFGAGFRLSCLLLLLLLAGCTPSPELLQLHGSAMGTTWQVTADAPAADASQLRQHIDARLADLVQQMSAWEPDSALNRFNHAPAGNWQPLPPDLFHVLEQALELAELTEGAYDPSIAPLVAVWGFGPGSTPRSEPPSAEAIAAARARVGYSRLQLDRATRRALQPGDLHLDINSLGPGHAVDAIADVLHQHGVHAYLVELGGEMRAAGQKPDGRPWRVAIERPDTRDGGDFDLIVNLRDKALGTSGDYRSGFVHQGRHYSHTLDPRSGWPVEHTLAAVTVIDTLATRADARAAALMVLGPEHGMALAEAQHWPAVFTLRTDAGYVRRTTPAFEPYRSP